ncbi:MAG: 16S rRNA (guanine(527)-N(7))-methyltransferase RsmG [Bacillota bacterium]|nr:16S rRNA (guanine(527)-N(7))-methyltransferase RsmG [Bacillota bacterium]
MNSVEVKMKDKLIEGAKAYGINLDDVQCGQLIKYIELLREWNEKVNLTAITEPDEIITKHFLDSMSVFETKYIKDTYSVIDVGTGAGFPGLVLKIVQPKLKVTLLDSLAKRLNFLQTVCSKIGIEDINFVHLRAEDGGTNPKYREKYDVAIARAVANMSVLSEYLLPFVKEGGYFIAQKGPLADEELEKAGNAITLLGGKIEKVADVQIPYTDLMHRIVVVKKIKSTPKIYPRKAGIPSKKPL